MFSTMIKTSECWMLQGSYGRVARKFIEAGIIDKDGTILIDENEAF